MRIAILGPDGAGKSTVLAHLVPTLGFPDWDIQIRHLKSNLFRRRQSNASVEDPHGKPPRGFLFSAAKIIFWCIEEWNSRLLNENPRTLLLCDRYFHDLLIDSRRYRYGAPLGFARLIGKMMPEPELWVLLDAPAEILQARKREVSLSETARQRKAYLQFISTRKNSLVVDSTQPIEDVVSSIREAITQCAQT